MTDSAISDYRVERLIERQRSAENRTVFAAFHPRRPTQVNSAQGRAPLGAKITSLTFSSAVVAALWVGWLNRDDSGLTPESGTGYWLGLAGGVLMLLLLLYPLRKRMRSLRVIGTVPFWFRAHMVLGACGCALVLWHANFRLGSINSSVALIAMLVVAVSGIFGRYLYSKVHRGLHGRQAVARELLASAKALQRLVVPDPVVVDPMLARLNAFAQFGTTPPNGLLAGLAFLTVIAWRGAVLRARLIGDARQAITVAGRRHGWSRRVQRQQLAELADLVTLHIAAVKSAATFAFYERLFKLWHLFHVPLFFLLVIATLVHVYAAHFF